MSIPKKKAVVSRKVSDEQLQNAKRWESFLIASGTPIQELSDEWYNFFDKQADVATASVELVKLIDLAIEKDNLK
jgi:hypothetical protein